MEFTYQKHEWNSEINTIDPESLVHAPSGLGGAGYQFIDLFNEGLNGILTEQASGWYYKHNLGDGRFEQAKLVTPKPSFSGLGSVMQLADLDADGGKQLVSYRPEYPGFFELDDDNDWQGLRSFKSVPNIDFGDANTRMLDLNGDGRPEVVISENNVFTWYASEGREGFAAARKTVKPFDEEEGPHIVFADAKQTIYLADMSGDGMTDIVRIRNGEVCYWPNLGYGKFGAKVMMDQSPVFDYPDAFNPGYIQLTDIDGSGTTDIVYLGKSKFTCWKNLSGNRFGATPFEIENFPEIHSQAQITVTDLLGNGVACIVWSSPLSKDETAPLKYIDLMKGKKPHIMVSYKNNMGKEVALEYTPSTKFYVEDKLAGKPWITKLHFPIHCISKTITEDKISGYRFESSYKYHHGYYDHAEREFRGFGMVEQTDAETFEHWVKQDASNITEEPLHQEPVVSKQWFHTGAFLREEKILGHFEKEYWYHEYEKEFGAINHPEIPLPDAYLTVPKDMDASLISQLSASEWQEAVRACKSMALRSEVFAQDAVKYNNTDEAKRKEKTPFNVATHNCVIELLQPRGKNKYAVFVVKESEAIAYSYERNPEDPRIAHSLNIELDEYGNVLEAASVVYPRRIADASLPAETQQEQSKTVIIYTENKFTNDVLGDDVYRLRLPSEVKTFDLKGVAKSGEFYSPADFSNILDDANSDTAFYHELDKPTSGNKAQKRLIEHVRSLYYRNDLTGVLPLHQLESLALPFESYQLAYTPELVSNIFDTKVNAALLTEGKFTHNEGDNNWWVRSGTIQFKTATENQVHAQNRFYSPISYTDPYGGTTKVVYYGNYFLFIEETEDVLGNKTKVDLFNFRTLSPQRMKDINNNLSEAISDELGLVKAVAVMGKGNEADDLTGLSEMTDTAESNLINDFFFAPDSTQLTSIGKNLLNHASARFVYDFEAYIHRGKPAVVTAITREQHFQKLANSPVQIAFEYSNGIGEVVMKKVQAEPGKAKQVILNSDETVTINEVDTGTFSPRQLRWIGNGRTVKNNKGNVVKQYEPYFSVSWHYEDYKELVETGVTPIMYYDAAGRLIKTEMPDGTFSKVVFDSWKQVVHDANDTVLESDWYNNRSNRLIDTQLLAEGKDPGREKISADKAAKHANTPNVLHLDTLGRPVLQIEHNGWDDSNNEVLYYTKIQLDTEGNLRTVTDARGNTVMQYKYDMLGNMVYQKSMDAGQRWLLTNILSKPLRTWDERDHEFQYFYDIAQRATHSKVIGGDGITTLDNIFDRVIYGESLLATNRSNETALQARNILGQVIQHYDTGGLIDTPDYDFKGQPLATTRKLFKKYKEVANWADTNLVNDLETDEFTFITETDALGRITRQTAPGGSIITPDYNEAGLLNAEKATINGQEKTYIKDIDYDEQGRRSMIKYGNGVNTVFSYDKLTFRLTNIKTRKNNTVLQDLSYTYDPVGNITHIRDDAHDAAFFNNRIIEPYNTYTYDALYRLIKATGRENTAPINHGTKDNWHDSAFMHSIQPNDAQAVRRYEQTYTYDAVGNIMFMDHKADNNNWKRKYTYHDLNNRLKTTEIGSQTYEYPHHSIHGYITTLPHLEYMDWNFKEELATTSRQKVNQGNGTPETTYYQYDGSGQRIRKITENQAAPGMIPTKKDERVYIAGYEVYKKHSSPDKGLIRTSLSLMDTSADSAQAHRFVMIETRNEINDGTEPQLIRYQLHNHLGSATIELDHDARIISYEEYHPYGTTAYQLRNAAIHSTAKRYRYTGMERDEESGLAYHTARYYLPWLGRWLSADPIGIEGGMNVYGYANSNPVNNCDLNGESPFLSEEVIREMSKPTGDKNMDSLAAEILVYQAKIRQEVASVASANSRDKTKPKKERIKAAISARQIKSDAEQILSSVDSLYQPEIPILNTSGERRASILNGTPGIIHVRENPVSKGYPFPLYFRASKEEVSKHEKLYEYYANKYNINPDFVKAIAYMESTHGWYDEYTGIIVPPKTIRPMNIYAEWWGIPEETLKVPEKNIDIGAYLLSEIWSRVEHPTPEKVATLFNSLSQDSVTDYGKTVAYYMDNKSWLDPKGSVRIFPNSAFSIPSGGSRALLKWPKPTTPK